MVDVVLEDAFCSVDAFCCSVDEDALCCSVDEDAFCCSDDDALVDDVFVELVAVVVELNGTVTVKSDEMSCGKVDDVAPLNGIVAVKRDETADD